jgi:hypothetical protein
MRLHKYRLAQWLRAYFWLGGLALLLLPWLSLRTPQFWWRAFPSGLVLALVVGVGLFFIRNGVDVTTLGGRLVYVGSVFSLLVAFLMFSFWIWYVNHRRACPQFEHWWPRLIFRVLNAGLVCLLVLEAVEASARVCPIVSSMYMDPGLVFHWPDYFRKPNSLGCPDREPGPKDRPRVLAIGDSYTQGAGVPWSRRFSNRLQDLFEADGHPVEVFNAGGCGLDTFQEADVLDRVGDAFQPDVVVVGYCLNDAEGEFPESKVTLPSLDGLLLGKLHSYAFYRLRMLKPTIGFLNPPSVGPPPYCQQHEVHTAGWKRVERGLDRIATWCDARGVTRVLLVFPWFTEGAGQDRSIMKQVERAASQRGFLAHHMLDDFDGRWGDLAVSRYDAHPGADAHERIAHKLHELLGRPEPLYHPPASTLSVADKH